MEPSSGAPEERRNPQRINLAENANNASVAISLGCGYIRPQHNFPTDDGAATTDNEELPVGMDIAASPASDLSLQAEADQLLSVKQVSQMMREQDAELLESMHYAASQVSQYSPGGTPVLRPKDRSLPMDPEDIIPFLLMPLAAASIDSSPIPTEIATEEVTADLHRRSIEYLSSSSGADFRAAAFHEPSDGTNAEAGVRQRNRDVKNGSQTDDIGCVVTDQGQLLQTQNGLISQSEAALSIKDKKGGLRRLLSGEIRTADTLSSSSSHPPHSTIAMDHVLPELNTQEEDRRREEDHKDTVMDHSMVADTMIDEISGVGLPPKTPKKPERSSSSSSLAEQRRVREALQFAEAVGEKIGHRDQLRIIEDDERGYGDGHYSDGDSDDEACESKEVIVVDSASVASNEHANDFGASSLEPANALLVSSTHSKPPVAPIILELVGQTLELSTPASTPAKIRPQTREEAQFQLTPHRRKKSKRPQWPFGPAGSDYDRFLDNFSESCNSNGFVYKGICANPPEITKRGIQRGNYAQLHRKAWLEVSDKYHRYGKNLRSYYRYWERLEFPTNQFFAWLDSKGEAAGKPLPHLDECPRSVLDSDTVLYISDPEVTDGYAVDISCQLQQYSTDNDKSNKNGHHLQGCGRVIDVDGSPVITGTEGWIFVLRDGVMYGAEKITSISGHSKQRFHHSSFFGGKAVAAAGIIITDEYGFLIRLYPHSGHYRPGEAHMQRMLFFLHRKGVDLRSFEMDTQQFRHVSREKPDGDKKKKRESKTSKNEATDTIDGAPSEKKTKKVDSLHMEKAVNVACFLAHKASFIGKGIFDQIHMIRKADVTSVSEALDLVDHGGNWPRRPLSSEEESP